MKKNRLFSLITSILAILFATVSMAATPSQSTVTLEFNPDNFEGDEIDNPYFPLKPGTTFVYRGVNEGERTLTEVTVTNKTREVAGVTVTVVHQINHEAGVLIEDTFDWFAQDKDGNVWYFGEDTTEFDEDGNGSTEGSWEAGVDGALPGVFMLADPQVGDIYQQEFYPGVADGMAEVVGFEDSLCVRYGCFEDVLVIKEWSPMEPGIVENKYYAKGVGFISAVLIEGGEEQSELVRVRHQKNHDNDDNDNDNRDEGHGDGRDD